MNTTVMGFHGDRGHIQRKEYRGPQGPRRAGQKGSATQFPQGHPCCAFGVDAIKLDPEREA